MRFFCNIFSECKQIGSFENHKMSIAKLNNMWILRDICFYWCSYFWFVCVSVFGTLTNRLISWLFSYALTLSPLKVLSRKSESEIFECSHSRACLTSTPPHPSLISETHPRCLVVSRYHIRVDGRHNLSLSHTCPAAENLRIGRYNEDVNQLLFVKCYILDQRRPGL